MLHAPAQLQGDKGSSRYQSCPMATGAGDPDAACRDSGQFDTKAGRGMMGNGGLEGDDGSLVALALAFSVLRFTCV